MKCVKQVESGIIERVSDHEADARVKSAKWMFVPKAAWKAARRIAK